MKDEMKTVSREEMEALSIDGAPPMEQGKMMLASDLLDMVRRGEVTAPVGTKTLVMQMVCPDGRVEMAGTADPNHALQLAYLLMKQVFEPRRDTDQ